jgi:hypothetical protein
MLPRNAPPPTQAVALPVGAGLLWAVHLEPAITLSLCPATANPETA